MIRVVIESPLKGNIEKNIKYAQLCCIDCLRRNEAPYASHLLMTQFLDDANLEDRKLGIESGFVWGECCDKIVVYQDLGISEGMLLGISKATNNNKNIEYRNLPSDLLEILNSDLKIKNTKGI